MDSMTAGSPQLGFDKVKAQRGLMWFGIISIVMLFAGLTSAYIVRMGDGKWVQFALPNTFIVSTLVILASSVSMHWAVRSAATGNQKNLVNALWMTLLLGLGFVFVQYIAWSELFEQGIALTGRIRDIKSSDIVYIPSGKETMEQAGDAGNVAGSFLYVITGLHILHLLGGMIALFVVIWRANRKIYTVEQHNGVKMCALYWHFLSGLWLYLFFFLLYVR
jgi:cytochrome c oxidase subunit 3